MTDDRFHHLLLKAFFKASELAGISIGAAEPHFMIQTLISASIRRMMGEVRFSLCPTSGVPTLYEEGVPTLNGGIYLGWGGTYPGQGVSTLDQLGPTLGSTYLDQGDLASRGGAYLGPWGVPTLELGTGYATGGTPFSTSRQRTHLLKPIVAGRVAMVMLVAMVTDLGWRKNYAGLTEVPTNIPNYITWIQLEGNKITTLRIPTNRQTETNKKPDCEKTQMTTEPQIKALSQNCMTHVLRKSYQLNHEL